MLNHYLRKVPIADLAKGLLQAGQNAEKNDFLSLLAIDYTEKGQI